MTELSLTQENLKSILLYDSDSGLFFWNEKPSRNIRKMSIAGSRSKAGYIMISINRKKYRAHRLAWLYVHGEWPDCIDHINHHRHDNQFINLRSVSKSINYQNKPLQSNNKTGVHGIKFDKRRDKWEAKITVFKKIIYLGAFKEIKDAIKVRLDAEIKYNFHPNHGK